MTDHDTFNGKRLTTLQFMSFFTSINCFIALFIESVKSGLFASFSFGNLLSMVSMLLVLCVLVYAVSTMYKEYKKGIYNPQNPVFMQFFMDSIIFNSILLLLFLFKIQN